VRNTGEIVLPGSARTNTGKSAFEQRVPLERFPSASNREGFPESQE